MLGGVAAGLADYFGIDPVWFRLAFVVSAFLGGAGIIVYLAMWVLVPPVHGPSGPSAPLRPRMERIARRIDQTPAWVGVVLLVVGACCWSWTRWSGGGRACSGDWPWSGLGCCCFRRAGERPRAVPPPKAADLAEPLGALPPRAAASPLRRLPSRGCHRSPLVARPAPRERSPLGWMTMGAILLALGVAALLDQAGVINVSLVQYLALPLALMGVGLLVGAFWGGLGG